MMEDSGFVIVASQEFVILIIPGPPSLVGRAKKSHVNTLGGGLPMSAGIDGILMHSSSHKP